MSNEQHMTSELHAYYQDIDNCYRDLCEARRGFGSAATTEEQYDQIEKGLSIMYLHCPEELHDIVLATIDEAEMRRFYFETKWMEQTC